MVPTPTHPIRPLLLRLPRIHLLPPPKLPHPHLLPHRLLPPLTAQEGGHSCPPFPVASQTGGGTFLFPYPSTIPIIFAALDLGNLEHASSIARLNQLLRDDYRGIIVTMIHKFRDIPANLNQRKNIYVLIDEAHRISQRTAGLFQQHHNVLGTSPPSSAKRNHRG
jgi:hypothetical protein